MDPAPATDRHTAQAWLQRTGYKPGRVTVSPAQRLGASIARANVSFGDHPPGDRLRGHYRLVTVESLAGYLDTRRMLELREEIWLSPPRLSAPARAAYDIGPSAFIVVGVR